MTALAQREVAFVTRILTHYRVPFHDRVHDLLAGRGVAYRLLYGQPASAEAAKGDLARLPWAEEVWNIYLGKSGRLVWQPIHRRVRRSDLVVLGQENGLLANYLLQSRRAGPNKVAFFGHGRNFQSRRPGGFAERWKRLWATRVDWWFAYTDQSRRHIESLGFPLERITVFNNAIDTSALRAQAGELRDGEAASALAALGVRGGNVGIFVGGLYPDKRLDFLIESAERVRARIPDFELLVVGGGSELPKLQALAASRPWLHLAGPRFGREKAALMRGAKLFLMPGLVGLAVLDAAALGLPMVTTAFPWHSPEFAYLEHGRNGVVVEDWRSAEAYGDAVAELMLDDARRASLAEGARALCGRYTIDAMAERFTAGVLAALERNQS